MNGQPLCEIGHGGLCGRVGGNFGERPERVHGGNIENGSGLATHHIAGENLRRKECSEKIQVENEGNAGRIQVAECFEAGIRRSEILGRKRFLGSRSFRVVSAGTVEQNVDIAEIIADRLINGFQRFPFKDIARIALCGTAVGGDFGGNGVGRFLAKIENRNTRTRGGECFREGATKNAAATGDNGRFSGEREGIMDIRVERERE